MPMNKDQIAIDREAKKIRYRAELEEANSHKPETYQDDMTLDEIGDYDMEMVKDAVKDVYLKTFNSARQAQDFHVSCVFTTLKRLGMPAMALLNGDECQQVLDSKGIKVETRKYKDRENWRNGTYIYSKDVLVAFVSNVLAAVSDAESKSLSGPLQKAHIELYPLDIERLEGYYGVVTNAQLDNKIFSIGTERLVHKGIGNA